MDVVVVILLCACVSIESADREEAAWMVRLNQSLSTGTRATRQAGRQAYIPIDYVDMSTDSPFYRI